MLKDNRKHVTFLFLIFSAVVIRLVWSLLIANEYWGDAYHNLWIIAEYEEYEKYIDYKDRHLVWLPLFRWLLIAFNTISREIIVAPNLVIFPLVLQLIYVSIVSIWTHKNINGQYQNKLLFIFLFLPMPILFSAYNMPEALALILLSILVINALNELNPYRAGIIFIMSTSLALTRHESTVFLGILTLILFIKGNRYKSFTIASGVLFGLIIWSLYNYQMNGEALFWLTSKFTASSSGASESLQTNGVLNRLLQSFSAICLAVPILVLVPFFKSFKFKSKSPKILKDDSQLELIMYAAYIYLIIFVFASLFFFHGSDVKYLVSISFIISLITFYYVHDSIPRKKQIIVPIFIAVLIPVFMVIFYARSYNLELERNMGYELDNLENIDGKVWNDFPVSLIHSNINPSMVVSSEMISKYQKDQEDNEIRSVIEHYDIEYIVTADSDRTLTLELIPELSEESDFSIQGIEFKLVRKLYPPQKKGFNISENPFSQLSNYSMSMNRPISIWEVSKTEFSD